MGMESTKQIQSFLKCKTKEKKSNSGLQTRKGYQKTRIPNRVARKGQFYKLHQLNRYHEAIFT